jgi:hypothetical protein
LPPAANSATNPIEDNDDPDYEDADYCPHQGPSKVGIARKSYEEENHSDKSHALNQPSPAKLRFVRGKTCRRVTIYPSGFFTLVPPAVDGGDEVVDVRIRRPKVTRQVLRIANRHYALQGSQTLDVGWPIGSCRRGPRFCL